MTGLGGLSYRFLLSSNSMSVAGILAYTPKASRSLFTCLTTLSHSNFISPRLKSSRYFLP